MPPIPSRRSPRHRLLGGLGLLATSLALASVLLLAQAPVRAAGNCTVASADLAIDREEQALLDGLNAYRQQHGLRPLKLSPALTRAAAWMSRDMAAKNYFSHTDSLGRAPATRIADCGYPAATTSWGENIAAGYADAANTLTQWKNSPSHNEHLLGSSYVVAGIGRAYDAQAPHRWYWTLDLGGADDSTAGGAPPATATATPPTRTPSCVGVLWGGSLLVLC